MMTVLTWVIGIFAVLVLAILIRFFFLGRSSQVMVPQGVGLINGKLQACSEKPNCVCSVYPNDASHFIEPLAVKPESISGDTLKIFAFLKEKFFATEQATLVTEIPGEYLHFSLKSGLFGFVDDIEFQFEASTGKLQVRSSSRVGHSDLGVNRKRVEMVRTWLNEY